MPPTLYTSRKTRLARHVGIHAVWPSLLLLAAPALLAQTTTVQSGNWSDDATWSTGTAPTSTAVTISDGHTVTGDTNISSSSNIVIIGTLDVGTGVSISAGRVNNGVSHAGTINVNGGYFSATYFFNAAGTTFNVNATSGGTVNVATGVGAYTTFNIASSGKLQLGFGGTTTMIVNLATGSHVEFTDDGISRKLSGDWNGATLATNGFRATVDNAALGWIRDGLNGVASSTWDLSTKDSKIVSSTANTGIYAVTSGTVAFDVYSSVVNDADQIQFTSTGGYTFSSDVTFRIDGKDLSGNSADYIGKSYQLFDYASGDYADIQATIASTVWNIDGADYEVSFVNNLATNGTVTVDSLTLVAIPEPSALAALLGLGAFGFSALRRRR